MRLEEYQNFRLGKTDVFQGASETAKSAEAELKNLDAHRQRKDSPHNFRLIFFNHQSVTVCRILFIPKSVQKKYTKEFVGGKNRLNPREDWLVTYGHHEPIP